MKNLIKVLVLALAFVSPMAISTPGVQAGTAQAKPTTKPTTKPTPNAKKTL
ncbi:MAG: hypothetical protein ACK5WC_10960 [Aphanizomenon sp.]